MSTSELEKEVVCFFSYQVSLYLARLCKVCFLRFLLKGKNIHFLLEKKKKKKKVKK